MNQGERVVITCGLLGLVGLLATVVAEHVFSPLLYLTLPLAAGPMLMLVLIQIWAGISGIFPGIRGSI